jgi:putative transposase
MIKPFHWESYRAAAMAAAVPDETLMLLERCNNAQKTKEPASRSQSTLLDSIKMPGRPPLGSAIETKVAIRLEHDEDIVGYFTQVDVTFTTPLTKANGDAGGKRMRVDLLALRDPEKAARQGLPIGMFIDCKSEQRLIETGGLGGIYTKDASTGRWRHLAAEKEVYERWGLGHKVAVERDGSQFLAENVDYLWDYFGKYKRTIPSDILAAFKAFVAENPGVTMLEAESAVPGMNRDLMLQAVADREVAVLLEEESLRERHRAHLFATAAIAEFYSAGERLKKIAERYNSPPVLQIGERLVIDDIEADIVELPNPDVVKVRNEVGELRPFPRNQIQEMYRQGRLRSLGHPTEKERRRRDTIRKLRPEQVEAALDKLRVIEPRLSGRVKRARPGHARLTSTHKLWLAKARSGVEQFGDAMLGLVGWECCRGGRKPRIGHRDEQFVIEQLKEVYLSARQTKQDAYKSYKKACEAEKLSPVSYVTFFNRLKKIPAKLQAQLRDGIGGANQVAPPSIEPPSLGAVPQYFLHTAHIDETPFDLALIDSRLGAGNHVLGTATLAIMFDTYSRSVLAFVLTFESPSYVATTLPLLRKCILRWKRLPRWILTDNGPAFKDEYASVGDNLRVGLTWRPSWAGRNGAQLERFNGVTQQDVAQGLPGSTKIINELGRVPPSHHPDNHASLFLAAATRVLEKFFEQVYDGRKHSALSGHSPREVREASVAHHGDRSHVQIDLDSPFEYLLMPRPGKRVQKIQHHKGVQAFGLYYWSEHFNTHQGETVDVRYDPLDYTRVFVYLDGQWRAAHHLPSRHLRAQLSDVQLAVVSMRVRRDRREFRKTEKEGIRSVNLILKELHDGTGDPIELMRMQESAKAAIDQFPHLVIEDPDPSTPPATAVTNTPVGLPLRRNP